MRDWRLGLDHMPDFMFLKSKDTGSLSRTRASHQCTPSATDSDFMPSYLRNSKPGMWSGPSR